MTVRRGHCFVFCLVLAILITTVCSSVNGNSMPVPIVLYVHGSVTSGNWIRDAFTDLPDYESTVSYSVSNSGNLDETNVTISISIGGNPYSTNVIPLLAMSTAYNSSFSYSTPYNQTKNVLIAASCQGSYSSCTLTVGSTFPTDWSNGRNLDPTVELFVTPNEQNVTAMKKYILSIKSPLDADWTALWSWVGLYIKYSRGSYYHWQFPWETLQSREGMCVDYSTLLVSLYRDGVFGPNDVYVVCGLNQNGEGHAWVTINLPVFGWYSLDPQENGGFLLNPLLNPFVVSGYTAYYEFNDRQFIQLGPSVTISPSSAILDIGQSRLFTYSITSGTFPFIFQWYLNGVLVSSSTSGIVTGTWTFTPTSAGSYTVWLVVTDSFGRQATSNAANVAVSAPARSPVYFSVEPAAVPPLTNLNASINGLETPASPSPIGDYFTVTMHFIGATAANVPAGFAGLEVHFDFSDILSWATPINFTDETGTFLSSTLYGLGPAFFAANGTKLPNANGATQYEVAAATSSAGNVADGVVAVLWFQIIAQPSQLLSQPNFLGQLTISFATAVDGNGNSITVGIVQGTLQIDDVVPFHGVAVTNVTSSKTVIGQGYSLGMSLVVADLGSYVETFNVTVFANDTFIGFSTVTDLPTGMSTVLNFSFNTAGFAYGSYTLSAIIESNTASNTYLCGHVTITIPGDVNGDFKVNLLDLVEIVQAYNSRPGDSNWNPNADTGGNGKVDLVDLIILATNYGKTV